MIRRYAAVDLGASSGRVITGTLRHATMELDEVHRFANGPVLLPDGYRWDVLRLWSEVLAGLRRANDGGPLVSIGIDSWGVDHGLLDRDGALLGNPWHHRDNRTAGVPDEFSRSIPADDLYEINGLQQLPIATLYQLIVTRRTAQGEPAARMLLIPDLLTRWLTGVEGAERTNASTTGLLDATRGEWSTSIVDAAGIPASWLPALRQPGAVVGPPLDAICAETGLTADVAVTTVASHDTASALVGIPADGPHFAYIACGTWALVGVELDAPVLTAASRAADFTNEVGIDGTVRYLRNVIGLWVLSETLRSLERAGRPAELRQLIERAAELPAGGPVVDVEDPSLLAPGDMPLRLGALCRATGQAVPNGPAAWVRCILDSLAGSFARAIEDARRLTGHRVDVVHIVGGGSLNALLCQLTADSVGLPVIAGPSEATAIGNLLVQARAHGDITGGLPELRAVARRITTTQRYEPRATPATCP